jgi:hypothetical protein
VTIARGACGFVPRRHGPMTPDDVAMPDSG